MNADRLYMSLCPKDMFEIISERVNKSETNLPL